MIRCRLLELMGRRGIRFMSRLSDETGVNRRTLAMLAENRVARFDSDVLERLCAYFQCQPGDLLEYAIEQPPVRAPAITGPGAALAQQARPTLD